MAEQDKAKCCPFSMVARPAGPWPAWRCITDRCAWWTGQECAIVRIAAGIQLPAYDPHMPGYVAGPAEPAQPKEGDMNRCETCTYSDECETSDSLQVRCAWCGKPLGSKPGQGTRGVTHRICEECTARLFAGLEEFMKEKEEYDG